MKKEKKMEAKEELLEFISKWISGQSRDIQKLTLSRAWNGDKAAWSIHLDGEKYIDHAFVKP